MLYRSFLPKAFGINHEKERERKNEWKKMQQPVNHLSM